MLDCPLVTYEQNTLKIKRSIGYSGNVRGNAYRKRVILKGTAFLGTMKGSKSQCEYGCLGMV
jgi:hypothetical protein